MNWHSKPGLAFVHNPLLSRGNQITSIKASQNIQIFQKQGERINSKDWNLLIQYSKYDARNTPSQSIDILKKFSLYLIGLIIVSMISSCQNMTDRELKAFRCREWIQNGKKPIETPYKILTGQYDCLVVPNDGFGPYSKRVASPSNLCRHPTDQIVSEATQICHSLLK